MRRGEDKTGQERTRENKREVQEVTVENVRGHERTRKDGRVQEVTREEDRGQQRTVEER